MTELAIAVAALIVLGLGWILFGNKPKPPNSPHFDTGYVLVWRTGSDRHNCVLTYLAWDGVEDDAKIRSNALVFETYEEAQVKAAKCKMPGVIVEKATDAVARIRAAETAYDKYHAEYAKYEAAYDQYRLDYDEYNRQWNRWIKDPDTFRLSIPQPVAPVRPERPIEPS